MSTGTTLGKYTLVSFLGGGGFGRVYRAIQGGPGGFSRPVAVKVLRPSTQRSDGAIQSFAREARTIARLQHRNIVQVFEFTVESDQYLLVMELIDGVTLGPLMRRPYGPLPLWLSVAIAQEVCRGLQHAHGLRDEEGHPLAVVHRDVKPSNVLISTQGDVKLTDFGLAKTSLYNSDQLTDHGVIKGTPTYMSPEQWRGDPATPASDVFSLGAVLYEMCTGVSFAAFSPRGAVGFGRFGPPSGYDGQIPKELDDVLLASLATEPVDRPASGELLETLQRVLVAIAPPEQLNRIGEELAVCVSRVRARPQATEPEIDPISATRPPTRSASGSLPPFAPEAVVVKEAAEQTVVELDQPPTELIRFAPPRPAPAAPAEDGLGDPATIDLSDSRGSDTAEPVQSARAALELKGRRRRRRSVLLVLAGLWLATMAIVTWLVVADRAAGPGTASPAGSPRPDASRRDAARPSDHAPTHDRSSLDGARARDIASSVALNGRRPPGPRTRPRPRSKTVRPAGGPPGLLSVNADPWARVFLDGKLLGTTPMFQARVPSGVHQLRLKGANGKTVTRRIVVPPDGHLRLGMIPLQPR